MVLSVAEMMSPHVDVAAEFVIPDLILLDSCCLMNMQINGPSLPQLLWTTCQPAMQQLLQPISSQLLGLSSMLASASAAAAHSSSSSSRGINASNTAQLVPAALSAAQEQLSLLSAGAVTGGSALLSSLLQLVDVLVPEGPTGVCRDDGSGCSVDVTVAAAAAAMQAAFPVSDQQHSSQPRWLLLPQPQLQRGADRAVGRSSDQDVQELSSLLPTQQQQPGRFLVFRSALDAGHVHILPLDLAVAVLQLLQHLACYDSSCLHMLAAQLSSSCAEQPSSSSSSGLQRQHSIRPVALARSSSAVPDALQAGPSSSRSSSRVKFKWAGGTPQDAESALQLQLQDRVPRNSWQTAMGSLLAATQTHFNTLRLQEASAVGFCSSSSSSSSGGPTWQQQQQQHRSLPVLLSDAARCHSSLLRHVGSLLAAVAAELPVSLQPSLLQGVVSEQGLLLLLLQAESWTSRCIAAALLQQMLTSTEVAAVLAAAIKNTGPEITTAEQQQQQQQDDVIMIDVSEQPAPSTALQPLNHRAAGGSKAAAAAAAAGSNRPGKTLQQQQRQPAAGSSTQPQPHPQQQQQQQQQHLFVLAAPVVQELLLQLLDGFSFGLEEAFQTLQDQGPVLQQQQTLPPTTHSSNSSSSRGQGLGSSSSSGLCGGSSNAAGSGGSRASVLWGVFELQRRCCAVMAHLLHSRQDVLLLYSLDLQATAGEGQHVPKLFS